MLVKPNLCFVLGSMGGPTHIMINDQLPDGIPHFQKLIFDKIFGLINLFGLGSHTKSGISLKSEFF